MNEISEAILKFLEKADWSSPKDIMLGVYPAFKNRYKEKDTFRRLVTRSIKELVSSKLAIKHDIQPYYHLAGYQSMLNSKDSMASLRSFIEEYGIGRLTLSHILSLPITKIPIVKAMELESKRRQNLSLEIRVLYDFADGLSISRIASKYSEISNKTEALELLKKGIGILKESLFAEDSGDP